MEWKKLTKKSLPPLKKQVLLWIGLNDSDGGFPVIARRYEDGNETFMVYKKDERFPEDGFVYENRFRTCLWTEIETPERARQKQEKQEEIRRKNKMGGDSL